MSLYVSLFFSAEYTSLLNGSDVNIPFLPLCIQCLWSLSTQSNAASDELNQILVSNHFHSIMHLLHAVEYILALRKHGSSRDSQIPVSTELIEMLSKYIEQLCCMQLNLGDGTTENNLKYMDRSNSYNTDIQGCCDRILSFIGA